MFNNAILWWVLWIAGFVLPPLVMVAALIYPEWQAVRETGMCPPAPMDIPAYPCTPNEYLGRALGSPFAIMGTMVVCVSWGVVWGGVSAVGWLAYKWLYRPTA